MTISHTPLTFFWSVHTGCTKVSIGCTNCVSLIKEQSCGHIEKFQWNNVLTEDDWNGTLTFLENQLKWPFKLRKNNLLIWVNQLGDLFHPLVTDNERDRIFGVIARLPKQRFIISTRRVEAMANYLAASGRAASIQMATAEWNDYLHLEPPVINWPLPNVFVGVSVSTQSEVDVSVPILLTTIAEKRFVYVAPILEAIDLSSWPSIDWLVVRAEEGPVRRVPTPSWIVNLCNWAVAQNIPFFFKGWGEDIGINTEENLLNAAKGSIDLDSLPRLQGLRKMIEGKKWEQVP